MKINKETALDKLWDEFFGGKEYAKDFAGRSIKRSDYGNEASQHCWNVDHIFPEVKGGTDAQDNLQITHCKTNQEKGDKFPGFVANGINFTCKKVKGKSKVYKVVKAK